MAAVNAATDAAAAEAEDMAADEDGARDDKHLVEATGTTDGTHISAYAQLRGSDGDRLVALPCVLGVLHFGCRFADTAWCGPFCAAA
jgi:hypothetical protein